MKVKLKKLVENSYNRKIMLRVNKLNAKEVMEESYRETSKNLVNNLEELYDYYRKMFDEAAKNPFVKEVKEMVSFADFKKTITIEPLEDEIEVKELFLPGDKIILFNDENRDFEYVAVEERSYELCPEGGTYTYSFVISGISIQVKVYQNKVVIYDVCDGSIDYYKYRIFKDLESFEEYLKEYFVEEKERLKKSEKYLLERINEEK